MNCSFVWLSLIKLSGLAVWSANTLISLYCQQHAMACLVFIMKIKQRAVLTKHSWWTQPRSWWNFSALLPAHVRPLFTPSPCFICQHGPPLELLVTHQHHDLITHKAMGKITKRQCNHCGSTARGDVKSPSLLLLCHHAFRLVSLFSSPSDLLLVPLTPFRKLTVGGIPPGGEMAAPMKGLTHT